MLSSAKLFPGDAQMFSTSILLAFTVQPPGHVNLLLCFSFSISPYRFIIIIYYIVSFLRCSHACTEQEAGKGKEEEGRREGKGKRPEGKEEGGREREETKRCGSVLIAKDNERKGKEKIREEGKVKDGKRS